jgi:tRNA G18 (ribose-2'-O)-methylase SpoU
MIPQYGLVNSLNVQTAVAMAIDDYLRQWSMDAHPLE